MKRTETEKSLTRIVKLGSTPAPGVVFRALAENFNGLEFSNHFAVSHATEVLAARARPATPGAGVLPSCLLPLLATALAALGLASTAQAQLQTAGDLLVNIDATALAEGPLTSITNHGTLGGFFEAVGGDPMIPEIASFGTNATKGIRFDGGDYMQLVSSLGGAIIPAPAGLTGLNPTRSIEVWAMNPDIAPEEAMVSWGRRGDCAVNMSFNYGTEPGWGAMGAWCDLDLGWNNNLGAPAVKRWHHLVYTFDGTTAKVFADGVLWNSEARGTRDFNTHPDTAINLATQLAADAVTPTPDAVWGSLTLARVRIHDGALSDAQVTANYNLEKNAFGNPAPVVAEQLSGLPANRYSFNEPATNNAADLTFADSLGGADGTVRGANGQFTGSRLTLPGGPSATRAYGDLPNQFISSRSANNGGSGEVSLEGWVRVTASFGWSRIFDFGTCAGGELTGPGGGGFVGTDFFIYTAQIGGNTAAHRLDVSNNDPPGGGGKFADVSSPGTFNNDLYFAVTWKESTGELRVYENGVEVNAMNSPMPMSDLNDVNVWLGRSNFTFDNNTAAEYDELRVYNRILSPGEVLGNFQAGANTLNTGAQPVVLVDEPDSTTAFDTYAPRFAVAVTGTPPITYQWRRNGSPIANATTAVYSFSATLADHGAQFSCVVSNHTGVPNVVTSSNAVLSVVTQPIALRHRYSFNETAGTNALDSFGGAHGELREGSSFNGTGQAVLDGATGYINLPNDMLTNFTSITFELWVADNGSGTWARLFDFGNSTGGEDFPALPGPSGTQYTMLANPTTPGPVRGCFSLNSSVGEQAVLGSVLPTNQLKHVVWIVNAPMQTGRLFVDGVPVGESTGIVLTPAAIGPTSNNWLGRAQWGGDPFFHGRYDEFRIWEGAMTPAQVAASFAAGPDCAVCLQVAPTPPNQLTIAWPLSAGNYALEQTAALQTNAVWQPVTNAPTPNGHQLRVTLPLGAGNQFFRLKQ